jgi:hypothetical protein
MKYSDTSGAKQALCSLCAKFASSMWEECAMLRKSAPNHFLMCWRDSNAHTTNETKLYRTYQCRIWSAFALARNLPKCR